MNGLQPAKVAELAKELEGLRTLTAQLRAENARLLRLLELTPRQAAPPGPVQTGLFDVLNGHISDPTYRSIPIRRCDLYSVAMADAAASTVTDLARAFQVLSNPLRLQLLLWLREPLQNFSLDGAIADPIEVGVCVTHIRARIGLAQSTVSAYMAELQRAGLVKATRVGKWTHYKRDEQAIAELVALVGQTL